MTKINNETRVFKMVKPVIDAYTGKALALIVQREAGVEQVVQELNILGFPEVRGVLGMDFKIDELSKRFVISNGGIPELVDLVPVGDLNEIEARKVKRLTDGRIKVVSGTTDEILLSALGKIFGQKFAGVSMVDNGLDSKTGLYDVFVEEKVAVMYRRDELGMKILCYNP